MVNFGKTNKFKIDRNLHINKVELNVEKQYKYLGIILNSNLKFEAHYKEIVKTFSFRDRQGVSAHIQAQLQTSDNPNTSFHVICVSKTTDI